MGPHALSDAYRIARRARGRTALHTLPVLLRPAFGTRPSMCATCPGAQRKVGADRRLPRDGGLPLLMRSNAESRIRRLYGQTSWRSRADDEYMALPTPTASLKDGDCQGRPGDRRGQAYDASSGFLSKKAMVLL